MSVVAFPKANARRISDAELETLRWTAEINESQESTKARRDLILALEELKELRWEKTHGR
jgi:hypothetical protein